MTVAKFVQPDFLTQTAAAYKAAIDAAIAVLAMVGGDYACHAKDTPDMQVLVDAGQLFLADSTLVSNAQQTSATIVAPVTNPRIDRIVINDQTGVGSIIAGTEAASPVAPAITIGTRPIAQILLQTSSTVITNSMITDERVVETYAFSTFIRTLLDDVDATAARATLLAAALEANTFTGPQTIQSAAPNLVFLETGVTADNARWDCAIDGEEWRFRALNDAGSSATNIIIVQRTGLTIGSIALGGPLTLSGTLTSPGLVDATGGQIKFPATQNASSDANTLDDYEEGTWTPGITFSGAAVGMTYTTQIGSYQKIGNRVTVNFWINLSAKGSSTGSALVTGLPFVSRNNADSYSAPALRPQNMTYTGTPTGVTGLGTTTMQLQQLTEAGTNSGMTETNFTDTTNLVGSLSYTTDG